MIALLLTRLSGRTFAVRSGPNKLDFLCKVAAGIAQLLADNLTNKQLHANCTGQQWNQSGLVGLLVVLTFGGGPHTGDYVFIIPPQAKAQPWGQQIGRRRAELYGSVSFAVAAVRVAREPLHFLSRRRAQYRAAAAI